MVMTEEERQRVKKDLIFIFTFAQAIEQLVKEMAVRIDNLPEELKEELLIKEKIKLDLFNHLE